jgi:hypothetical protein
VDVVSANTPANKGVSTIWRKILEVRAKPLDRLPYVLFFIGYTFGGIVGYYFLPAAYASPPYLTRPWYLVFLGGCCVAVGTEWSNGCTTGIMYHNYVYWFLLVNHIRFIERSWN